MWCWLCGNFCEGANVFDPPCACHCALNISFIVVTLFTFHYVTLLALHPELAGTESPKKRLLRLPQSTKGIRASRPAG